MITTANMGLKAWDLGADPYDHRVLANNWAAIDQHDHSPGKGVRLTSASLQDGAVTGPKIAADAVTPDKIPNGSLTQQELAPDSVGNPQLQTNAVQTPEIQNGAVTFDKLDPAVLPVGSVINWFRPTPETPLPSGSWEVLDGRAWNAVSNAWGLTSGFMPDLRGKFVLGAGTTNIGSGVGQFPDVGQTGGSHTKDLSHLHTVGSHSHSIPSHGHTIGPDGSHAHPIGPDGAHNHDMMTRTLWTFGQGTGGWGTNHYYSHFYTNGNETTLWRDPISRQAVYVSGQTGDSESGSSVPGVPAHSHGGATGPAGDHSHGGITGAWGGNTGPASATTDSQLGVTDIRPAYVGLIYIMRVR